MEKKNTMMQISASAFHFPDGIVPLVFLHPPYLILLPASPKDIAVSGSPEPGSTGTNSR